jgi:hypothetical protein
MIPEEYVIPTFKSSLAIIANRYNRPYLQLVAGKKYPAEK